MTGNSPSDQCDTRFSRVWAMPCASTFAVRPIGKFVQRYLERSKVSIDPFCRDNDWATWRNDINPACSGAHSHEDAIDYLVRMETEGVRADLAILDPPYSPRQCKEAYEAAGREVTQSDTQNGAFMKRVRGALLPLLTNDAIVLSFGWNSSGMGKGWRQLEILLVSHGGAHNDTICLAEQRP